MNANHDAHVKAWMVELVRRAGDPKQIKGYVLSPTFVRQLTMHKR